MPTRYTEAELNEQQKPAKWAPVVVAGLAVSLFLAAVIALAIMVA